MLRRIIAGLMLLVVAMFGAWTGSQDAGAAPGDVTLVSRTTAGAQGPGTSFNISITPNGRYIVFTSTTTATILTGNGSILDQNAASDVFFRDLQTGVTELISRGTDGNAGCFFTGSAGNCQSSLPHSDSAHISDDGCVISFLTIAQNLVVESGNPANGSQQPDNNSNTPDVYVRNRCANTMTLISRKGPGFAAPRGAVGGRAPQVSGNGQFVSWSTESGEVLGTTASPVDTNIVGDAYVTNLTTGVTERVSLKSGQLDPATGASPAQSTDGSNNVRSTSISWDGCRVVWSGPQGDLVTPAIANNVNHIYMRDRCGGNTTTVLSRNASDNQVATGDSSCVSLSANGLFATWDVSSTTIVTPDVNGTTSDVILRDIAAGVTSRVSLTSGGAQTANFAGTATISPDGRFVAFTSFGTDVVPPNSSGSRVDVFIRDRQLGTTQIGSLAQGNTVPNQPSELSGTSVFQCYQPRSFTADGSKLAFSSLATNLLGSGACPNAALDCNNQLDAFVREFTASAGGDGGSTTFRADFNGDGRADFAVWRPSNGTWYVKDTLGGGILYTTQWGLPSDIPVAADFNADGRADFAVWRPSNGTWFVRDPFNNVTLFITQWGLNGDVPIAADFNADGRADLAVWRPSNGTWFVRDSFGGGVIATVQWGLNGDVPMAGNFNTDNRADFAVWRPSTGFFYVRDSVSPTTLSVTQWGLNGDRPFLADFGGDGRADFAVWRPSTATWFVKDSVSGVASPPTQWGLSTDTPMPGDYTGDAKADYGVWRNSSGFWFVKDSASGVVYSVTQWGLPGDVPQRAPNGRMLP